MSQEQPLPPLKKLKVSLNTVNSHERCLPFKASHEASWRLDHKGFKREADREISVRLMEFLREGVGIELGFQG